MRNLKAFTIVELLVVMIISVITLATIYTVYLLVKKQYQGQSHKTELLKKYLQFKTALTRDFTTADSIKTDVEDKIITCYLGSQQVSYEFSGKNVIRYYSNYTDSFFVFPHQLEIALQENSTLVNQLIVKVIPNTDTVILQFAKTYAANCLIKIKPE